MENREANQAAFDKVVRHLLKQGEKSTILIDRIPTCAYRGPSGRMCAVGCLIPDSEYSPDLENEVASDVRHRVPSLALLDVDLLCDLQFVHDHRLPGAWPEELRGVADKHGLTMPDLEPSP